MEEMNDEEMIALNIPKQKVNTRGRKLKSLCLNDKIRLVKEIEKGDRTKSEIAREFGIAPSTLFTIFKSKDKLLEFAELDFDTNRKRMKRAKHPDVEEETLKWILSVQKLNLPITGPIIREKAQLFAGRFGYLDFQASAGWYENFQARYKLIFQRMKKNKSPVTKKDDSHSWKNDILPHIMREYQENNIFAASETWLCYKCHLDKNMAKNCVYTHNYFSEEYTTNYFSEEQIVKRVTLFVATNMSGSEKLPLLLIGKRSDFLCISHLKSLPVDYEINESAHVTHNIFETWLKKLDDKFCNENRKIVLMVNNNESFQNISDSLKSIKLIFIPQNLATHFQPMDKGIIRRLKYIYRKNLVLKFISSINGKQNCDPTMLGCMRDIHLAWENISASVILTSFQKVGFVNKDKTSESSVPPVLNNDDDDVEEKWRSLQEMSYIPSDMTFESYVNIDENFLLLAHITDDQCTNDTKTDDESSFKDSKTDHLAANTPSFNEAFFAAKTLRSFVESCHNVSSSVFQAIAQIDQFLLNEKCLQNEII